MYDRQELLDGLKDVLEALERYRAVLNPFTRPTIFWLTRQVWNILIASACSSWLWERPSGRWTRRRKGIG